MSARDRLRMRVLALAGVASVFVFGSGSVFGQAPADGRTTLRTKGTAKTPNPPARSVEDDNTPVVGEGKVVRVPVNPTDAVAIVNGETITRAQLAEQAFIRKGEEILDAMISRTLLEQAMRARKVTVSPQEIDAEIDKYANQMGVTREDWLRNLHKERKISPAQYKNDIIYPGLALKKLAENRVQVTEQDMKEYYEAQYGDKIMVRIIMTMRQADAMAMWKELKENPGSFAHMAANDPRSVDQATKPNNGLLEQPLTRHAYPRNVSDKAFEQLVDGDPADKDPSHKPKDGAITGPIQVSESTWIIMKREGLKPAMQYDPNKQEVREMAQRMIFDAKLKEQMSGVFDELIASAQVENKLTGQVKMANEDNQPGGRVDKNVKLMSDPDSALPKSDATKTTARPKISPAAVSPADKAAADGFKKTAAGAGTTKK